MAFNKAKALQEAERLVSQGKISQAIKQYSQILEKDPSDLALLNTIGDLYYREKNIPEALKHFQRLADAYVREGFTLRAIAIYKRIIKLEPSSAEPLVKLAELYMIQGLSREARDHYAQAVEFYKKKNQLERALEVFRKIVALDPENTTYRMRYAEFCEQAGRKEEAADAYLEVAEVALRHGDVAGAEPAVKKAVQLDPKNDRVHLLRARLAFSKRNLEEVERIFGSVPALKSNPAGRQVLLETYLAGHKLEAAESLLVHVFNADPEDFTPLASYSALCVAKGDFDAALKPLVAVADALLERKNTGPLMDSLRQIWMKSPQHVATLELIYRICERTADEFTLPEVLEALGHAYVQAGELQKAEAVYRKLVSREPENEHHKGLLRQVLQTQGKEFAVAVAPADLSNVEMALTPEAAPGPLPAPPAVDAQEALMVKEFLENSDLFSRYGLVDKAVAELEKVLLVYPDQIDIHKRILEVCHRSQPARARGAAEALARIYTERGDTSNVKRYEALVRQFGGAAPAEEFALPVTGPEAEAFPTPTTPEPAPAEAGLSPIFPVTAAEQPPAEQAPAGPLDLGAPGAAVQELDLSTDLEAFAKVTEGPGVEPEVSAFDYEDSRVEVDFYLEQGLLEEAGAAVQALEEKYPGNPQVAELRRRVELRAVPVQEVPEVPLAVEPLPEAPAAEWELPSSFAGPIPGEATPGVVPEVAPPVAAEPSTAPLLEGVPAGAEGLAAGGDLLGSLAGDLAASLEGFKEPAARAAVKSPPVAVPAGGAEAVSPLSGLLEELGEGAQAAPDDPETHYNLGVAFREMGLLDEAIGEFQKVVKGAQKGKYPPHFLQACSLLAVCFMDKGMPAIAVKWYSRALESPDLDEEAALALHYDLGVAYEQAGDTRTALEKFSEVYSQNIDYRDVAEKIRHLQQKAP